LVALLPSSTRGNCIEEKLIIPLKDVVSSSLPLARSRKTVGQIHSLFTRSYNIAFGRDLVNVASTGMECSSYGLKLSTETVKLQIKSLNVGDPAIWEGSRLQLFSSHSDVIKIDLGELTVLDLKLRSIEPTIERISAAARSLESAVSLEETGLLWDEKTILVLWSLCQPDLSEKTFKSAFDYLIGRGRGLTPSGDDVLFGYLMVQKLFGIPLRLKKLSLNQHQVKTTLISENYLRLLWRGYVSEYFQNYCQAVIVPDHASLSRRVERIRGVGATSGNDMLLGMSLAISGINGVNKVLPSAEK
jgi:hypothetical protein